MSDKAKEPMEQEQQGISELLQVRRGKLAALQQTDKDPFEITVCGCNVFTQDIRDRFEGIEGQDVAIVGRIMSQRDMGRASSMDIQDRTGRTQVYLKVDDIGEEAHHDLQSWSIDDLTSASDLVLCTRRGEISAHTKDITLLGKPPLPLPDKSRGLKDTGLQYRQCYVDLIVNPEVKSTFEKRSHVIITIRRILDEYGCVEVETLVLNLIPGGTVVRPLTTHHNTLGLDLYLCIALESCLKCLIIGGMEKVYEIGRLLRNEGMGVKHNPELMTVELYEAYTDYHDMMDLTECPINAYVKEVCGTEEIIYQSEEVSLKLPFCRMTMNGAIKQYAGVDLLSFKGDTVHALKEARRFHFETKVTDLWDDITNPLFEEKVKGKLIQPTFIYDYLVEVSSLTKRKKDMSELVERSGLFATRRELINTYFELNDPVDQRERFIHQIQLKETGDKEVNMIDEDSLTALKYDIPPMSGMGMGIDRLVMFLIDSASVHDVLLLPTMKSRE